VPDLERHWQRRCLTLKFFPFSFLYSQLSTQNTVRSKLIPSCHRNRTLCKNANVEITTSGSCQNHFESIKSCCTLIGRAEGCGIESAIGHL
jgi:hypothetical protein